MISSTHCYIKIMIYQSIHNGLICSHCFVKPVSYDTHDVPYDNNNEDIFENEQEDINYGAKHIVF